MNTNTTEVDIETVLEASDIPTHASIYDLGWTEDGDLEIEWGVNEWSSEQSKENSDQ